MKTYLFLIFGFFLLTAPAQAHHNYFSRYNPRVEITLEGVVTKVEWKTPHIVVYLDVTNDDGEIENWSMPNAAPFIANQNGWNKDTIVVGETLTFIGWPSRNRTKSMRAIEMIFDDGRSFEMQMWCKLNCAGHDLDGN